MTKMIRIYMAFVMSNHVHYVKHNFIAADNFDLTIPYKVASRVVTQIPLSVTATCWEYRHLSYLLVCQQRIHINYYIMEALVKVLACQCVRMCACVHVRVYLAGRRSFPELARYLKR